MSQHKMQMKLDGIVSILAENLYTNPDIFIRELIQNGHDALVKRCLLDKNFTEDHARIDIVINVQNQTLSISDNGAGLTKNEIHTYLSTVGNSDKNIFGNDRSGNRLRSQIGQFGIGLLSTFIVAHKVVVETRHVDNSCWLWENRGDGYYTLESGKQTNIGTVITLHLKNESSRYLNIEYIRRLIIQYADILGIPIYLQQETNSVTSVDAPWHNSERSTDKDWQKFWTTHLEAVQPVEYIRLNETFSYIDSKTNNEQKGHVSGLLAITDEQLPGINAMAEVEVYVQRMMINKSIHGILPPWATFIAGIVECDCLRPNAARDNIMSDGHLQGLQVCLGRKIISHLKELAVSNHEKMTNIMNWHAFQIIAMCNKEDQVDFLSQISDMVNLETNKGPTNLGRYLEHATTDKDGKKRIFYNNGYEDKSFYMNLINNSGHQVIDAGSGIVFTFLERYAALYTDKVNLCPINTLKDEIFRQVSEEEEVFFAPLVELTRQVLPISSEVVLCNFNPTSLPLLVVNPQLTKEEIELHTYGENPATPSYLKHLIQKDQQKQKNHFILYINTKNKLIQKLNQRTKLKGVTSKSVQLAMTVAYNNCLMLHLPTLSKDMIETLFESANRLVEEFLVMKDTLSRQELAKLNQVFPPDQDCIFN